MRLESKTLLSAYSCGLDEKTAIVELDVSGAPAYSEAADQALREVALALCPGQRLFGVDESGWPTAF